MEMRALADRPGPKSTLTVAMLPLRTSREVLLFLFICLMPFQDTILQTSPLQRLGSSFSILPLLALAFLSTADRVLTANLRVSRLVLYGSFYVFAVCLFGLLQFGLRSQDTNLVIESLKLCLETALVLFVIFGLDYSNERIISTAVQIAFWIAVFGVAAYDLNFLGLRVVIASPVFHQTVPEGFTDGRWRGLTKEPSVLAPLLMGIGLLSSHFSKSKGMKTAYWAITLAVTALSGSKGGIISMVLLVGVLFFAQAKVSVLRTVQLTLLAIPLAFLSILILLPQIATEAIMNSMSVATRLTMQIWTGIILLHFPFGVGFSGFIPAMKIYVLDAANILQSLSPFPLNFNEVSGYAYSAQDAGAKTLASNYAAYFGFPFLFLAGRFCVRLVRDLYRQRNITLLACILFLIIQLCTSVDSVAYYNLYLPFGIAFYQCRKNADSTSIA
jgi:hypothetical protein